jgi:hypothetical protein
VTDCVGAVLDAADGFPEVGRPPGVGKDMYELAGVLPGVALGKGRARGMVGAAFGVETDGGLLGGWEMSMVPNRSVRGLTKGSGGTAELLRMI